MLDGAFLAVGEFDLRLPPLLAHAWALAADRARPLRAHTRALSHLSVSEAARRLGANPQDISDLFYKRKLRDDLCPIMGGRRLIPLEYLDQIVKALKDAGRTVGKAVLP